MPRLVAAPLLETKEHRVRHVTGKQELSLVAHAYKKLKGRDPEFSHASRGQHSNVLLLGLIAQHLPRCDGAAWGVPNSMTHAASARRLRGTSSQPVTRFVLQRTTKVSFWIELQEPVRETRSTTRNPFPALFTATDVRAMHNLHNPVLLIIARPSGSNLNLVHFPGS